MANDVVSGFKSGLSGRGLGAALAGFVILVGLAYVGFSPDATAQKVKTKIKG